MRAVFGIDVSKTSSEVAILVNGEKVHGPDGPFVLGYALDQQAGVIGFQGFVGGFFRTAHGVFAEQGTGAGSLGPGHQGDGFIRAAHFFPVGDLGGEDVGELLFGQALDFFRHILVHDGGHGHDADFVVHQFIRFFLGQFGSGRHYPDHADDFCGEV